MKKRPAQGSFSAHLHRHLSPPRVPLQYGLDEEHAVFRVEAALDLGDVVADGAGRDVHGVGDVFVGQALHEEAEHFHLPFCELWKTACQAAGGELAHVFPAGGGFVERIEAAALPAGGT